MAILANIPVELTAMIGTARLPIGEIVKLGRGAVIPIGVSPDDEVALHAGGQAVATGDLGMSGDIVSITITQLLREPS